MRGTGTAAWLLAAAVLALLLGQGCAGGPGAFCSRDSDCHAGLRCTGSSAIRGICTYPPSSVHDAAPREVRVADRPRESRRLEAGPAEAGAVDGSREQPPADGAGN